MQFINPYEEAHGDIARKTPFFSFCVHVPRELEGETGFSGQH
jgi:hypothetical protein